jgi:hypothetical protein
LLTLAFVDRGVIATAIELFEARHYPGVIALSSETLETEPECIELLILRARANIALRRDLEAQTDLREIIRLDPRSSIAYRLLGQLAARRDENESAAIFFREALRLDPDDREASEWLQIVGATPRPAAAAQKHPAPAAAAGRFPRVRSEARSPARANPPRLAKGTEPPDTEEYPTARKSKDPRHAYTVPSLGDVVASETAHGRTSIPSLSQAPTIPRPAPSEPEPPRLARGSEQPQPIGTLTRRPSRPQLRGSMPELPGFGEYLVDVGILTRERLRAAQAYQRSMRVQLSTAIVTLGLATPQRIEWAAVAHQSQIKR